VDKYEFNLKSQQMRKLAADEKYDEAALIADEIDWKRVKNNRLLVLAADIYEATKQLEKEYDILALAYERTPLGKQLAYRLALVATALREFDDAEGYYEDFVEMAPGDPMRYLLRFRISKAHGEDVDVLIGLLERFLDGDMEEKWTYELCLLYDRAGYHEKCVDMCDELITWFGDGDYVRRAMELKKKYVPLTVLQQEKYDALVGAESEEDVSEFGVELRRAKYEVEKNKTVSEKMEEAAEKKMEQEAADISAIGGDTKVLPSLKELDKSTPTEEESADFDVNKIEIKSFSDRAYDTMNIQAELAKSMEELLQTDKGNTSDAGPIVKTFVPPTDDEEEEFPEEKKVIEKQITGQMSIEEILRDLQTRGILKEDTVEGALKVTGTLPLDEIEEEIEVAEEVAAEQVVAELEEATEPEEAEIEVATEEKVVQQLEEVSMREFVTEEIDLEVVQQEIQEAQTESVEINFSEIEVAATEEDSAMETVQTESEIEELVAEEKVDEDIGVLELDIDQIDEEEISDKSGDAESENEEVITPIGSNLELSDLGNAITEFMDEEHAEEEELDEETESDEEAESDDDLDALEEDLSELGQTENPYTQMKKEDIKRETERLDDVFGVINEMESELSEEDLIYNAYTEEEPEERFYLEEEDKEEFAQYLRITGMESQIAKAIQDHVRDYTNDGSSKSNNILITGEAKSGKSQLALSVIRALNRHLGRKGRKTARITGFNLNRKTLSASMPRLVGNDLLIEHAGEINKNIVFELMDILPKYTGGMIVVMEDEKARIDHLFEEYPLLAEFFPHRLDIKEYDINEWVAVAKSYAKSQGYVIDELGTLALYAEIDALYGILQGLEVDDIKDIIDDAIEHAERKVISRTLKRIFGKKEERGVKVLHESDFAE